ncbi:MAG: hypothetical protein NTW86_00660, partial [Candidatus Sumerlaeota bacterium]|nr:hypothetical protein [Candidatus Sumerlaeota bacterium]
MRIIVSAKSPSAAAADCLVCLSHPAKGLSAPAAKSAQKALGDYSRAVKSGRMSRLDIAAAPAGSKAARLLLAGVVMGARKTWPESERFRGAASQVYAHCKEGGERRVAILLNGPDGAAAAPWIAEGLLLGAYSFQQYKSKPSEFARRFSAELIVEPGALASAKDAVQRAIRVCECINFARDLINQPGSVAIPSYIAQAAASAAQEAGLACEIWDEKRLRDEGYNGLLTVGRGSADPPRMVVLRHRPPNAPDSPHL